MSEGAMGTSPSYVDEYVNVDVEFPGDKPPHPRKHLEFPAMQRKYPFFLFFLLLAPCHFIFSFRPAMEEWMRKMYCPNAQRVELVLFKDSSQSFSHARDVAGDLLVAVVYPHQTLQTRV